MRSAVAMVCELDISRGWALPKPRSEIDAAANLLIRKHGADAELEAAKRADLMLDRGDDDGRLLWMRIRRAIEALQAQPLGRVN
jgi:hypothetical protein